MSAKAKRLVHRRRIEQKKLRAAAKARWAKYRTEHTRVIIAGSYEQARYYADEHRLPRTDWRYVSGPEQVMGLYDATVIWTGTWYTRNDAGMLRDFIARYAALGRVLEVHD